jgi:thiol-disulfide isomerase/thioredoxin
MVLARWFGRVVAAGCSFLAACSLLAGCGAGLVSEAHPRLGAVVEPRSEVALSGAMVALPAPGKVTLVDVWQTSCEPCMKVMPHLQALHAEKASRGLVVVGVAADDNPGLVQQRLRALGVTYDNVVDAEGQVRGALGSTALPTTLLVDRSGKVRLVREGGDEADVRAIDDGVEALLSE